MSWEIRAREAQLGSFQKKKAGEALASLFRSLFFLS